MKSKHDSLGDRMKTYYEGRARTYLLRRTPVVIRIDGKAFHTFTRGFDKPFDKVMVRAMQKTTQYLCQEIMGCVLGYTQSDEISLVLIDYKTFSTGAWFDYEIQKVCSISASLATLAFNKAFREEVEALDKVSVSSKLLQAYEKALKCGGCFDARCMNVPKEEVTNYIFWRQLDACRNSVQSLAQCHYTAKALYCTNIPTMKRMLLENQKINWDDLPNHLKIGTSCRRDSNGNWTIDEDMPLLRGEDRKYLDDILTTYETSDITKEKID